MPDRIPSHKTSRLSEAAARKEYERIGRDAESKRFYNSAAWRKVRRLVLATNPLCETCRASGSYRSASHVHHKVELRDDPALALDLANLQPLCHACHSRHHASGSTARGG